MTWASGWREHRDVRAKIGDQFVAGDYEFQRRGVAAYDEHLAVLGGQPDESCVYR